MDQTFASLAQIRVLLFPVGTIHRSSFEKWTGEIKEFDEIRLSDVPADSRDDRARFMPNPLATGSLFLNFVEHPPSPPIRNLDLFRLSEFPLGIVGIASCSQSDALSSIYSQFKASVAELFPANSIYPLAQNCFVFEEGDGNTNLNVGNHMPGLVVIPSMMGNKKLYIGTLLAELCSNVLGEFSIMVKALETPSGSNALNNGLFARMPDYKTSQSSIEARDVGRPSSVASPMHTLPENGSASRQTDPRLNVKRASTLGPGIVGPNNRPFQQFSQTEKKRQVGIGAGAGTPRTHARLYKILGDLFLLAGRTMDASIWYNEAVAVLKGAQDLVWQASALEGMAVVGVLEAWATSNGSVSANSRLADSWADFGEKLSRASSLYAAAGDLAESDMAEVTYLYVATCLRHASLLYYIWLADGMNTLAFDALLHGRFDASYAEKLLLNRSRTVGGLSRGDVSEILAQAHGPWILHLGPRERTEILRRLAQMYARIRYRRKEAYILRELVACLLDILVQGREESRGASDASLGNTVASSTRAVPGQGNVGIRERENVAGNASILRVVRYICEVHGINLDCVTFATRKGANDAVELPKSYSESQHEGNVVARRISLKYLWPELQVGLIREALAVAEALPDYSGVTLFTFSALRDLYRLLEPEDQFHLHTAANRALATLRRRGDDRKLEFWPEDLSLNIHFVPLSFVRLPVERPWTDVQASSKEDDRPVRTDPFLFNPRRSLANKRQLFAVANEDLEFTVTLENPYSVALEVLELELSTSGVHFVGKPQAIVVQGNSSGHMTLSGRATEAGCLVVRGCTIVLPGMGRQEALLPIYTEEEEEHRFLRSIADVNDGERVKSPSLGERLDWKRKHVSTALSESSEKAVKPAKYLELKVVPEQPCLRIRRTSLTNGAVMLYDGETSTIRLSIENISTLPVDFMELTFDDSSKAYLEHVLNDELNAFDTYETEYSLVNRPVFSWKQDNRRNEVASGKETVILVDCFGKSGCTDGTIIISYSYARRERDETLPPPTVFYTRQLLFPVLVTVYEMLECSGMNILPISASEAGDIQTEWHTLLADVDDAGWCVMTLDVQNIYGLAFEVTLSYKSKASSTRVIPPGSTYRLVLPIERFSLPTFVSTAPIPSLTNRQFSVTGLSSEENRAQRELFWYREELLKIIRASWKEASGSRTGELSLRQQRFTQPMLNALRMDDIRVTLSLSTIDNSEPQAQPRTSGRGIYIAQTAQYVVVRSKVQNLTPSPRVLSLSLHAEPSDYFTYDGVFKDIPLGRMDSQESKEHDAVVVFLAQGQFKLSAQIRSVSIGQEARICGTSSILVEAEAGRPG